MLSRRTPSQSPQLNPLQHFSQLPTFTLEPPPSSLLSAHISTIIEEGHQEQGIPSIGNAVKNLSIRHGQELRDSVDILVPRVGQQQSTKKAFREFYVREAAHVFDFLEKPIASSQVLTQAMLILKRFGRGDYMANKHKMRDLVLDISCNTVYDALQEKFQGATTQGLSPFQTWVSQTRILLEQWRTATAEFADAEKSLIQQIQVFDEIHKKVQLFLQLPHTEGYEAVCSSMEGYLKSAFDDHKIEEGYTKLIESLKKIVILTDALSSIRQVVNASTEPLCSVCFNEPVALASVPCGHTFCGQCGTKQLTNCYICRTPITNRMKIFFS